MFKAPLINISAGLTIISGTGVHQVPYQESVLVDYVISCSIACIGPAWVTVAPFTAHLQGFLSEQVA